ncbi:MAG: FtsW/RodA/SpoVE family cell cycle protein [Bacteroidales bacterium]|jgi:cell division protein FtsW|nr:FtsW/RodA/SpoVE family cell cycle protein [Bacteroidales bacterium]
MNIINKILRGDKVIWIVSLILGIISLIVVYSATSALAVSKYEGDTGKVLMKHLAMLIFGFAMMILASRINYKRYAKIALLLMIPCLALLLYTLVFGRNINDASRSINVGGFSFQPSEMAKIILITYLARQLIMMEGSVYNFKDFLLRLALPILVTAALIFSENLSTAVILVAVCMVLLFIGRVKFLHLLALVGLCIAGMSAYLGYDAIKTNIENKHRRAAQQDTMVIGEKTDTYKEKQNRIQTWSNRLKSMGEDKEKVDPFDDKHMQRTYADIAVASSSIFGKGPGKSEQRNFLPHPYSDFIFAIIIEEYGLIGAVVVLLLYLILFTRVLRIVIKRPLTFGSLMAFGLGFLVILQAMVNMGVSIGLLPVTGQPLPFVSMGGTSLMATGLILGMILSVTRYMEDENMNKEQELQALTEITEDEREP